MKVLLLADANSIHTRKWVTQLSQQGVEIAVFSLSPSSDQFYSEQQIDCYSVELFQQSSGTLAKLKYLLAFPKLLRVLKQQQPDLLHAHYATSYGLLGALTFYKKFLITAWGSDVLLFPNKNRLFKAVLSWILNRAGAITSASNYMAEKVRALTHSPVSVVPFGVDTALFQPMDVNRTGLTIGTVKSLETVYGIDILIESFAHLLKSWNGETLKLVIIGSGSQEEALKKLVKELKIDENVEFKGRIPNTQLPEEYAKFNLTCFFSRSESFGVSVLEAALCGVPSVVANVGGLPEVVAEGRAGWILSQNKPDEIGLQLKEILTNQLEVEQKGKIARSNALKFYSIEQSNKLMISLYRQLINAKA